jgi:Flp pilus assembly protein TadG
MTNIRTAASVSKKLRQFAAGAGGVAAVEFALTGLLLVLGLLNAVDVGYYAYQRMEVENAAEVGSQAAWQTCHDIKNGDLLPATDPTKCPGMNAAVTAAIQSTTLGTAVSLASGYPTEGDYCVNVSNALQCVGSLSTPPPPNCSATGQQNTCAAAGNAATTPGDYLQVQVTYPYQPLFPGPISVMSVLGVTSISKTSWMRMG